MSPESRVESKEKEKEMETEPLDTPEAIDALKDDLQINSKKLQEYAIAIDTKNLQLLKGPKQLQALLKPNCILLASGIDSATTRCL